MEYAPNEPNPNVEAPEYEWIDKGFEGFGDKGTLIIPLILVIFLAGIILFKVF